MPSSANFLDQSFRQDRRGKEEERGFEYRRDLRDRELRPNDK